MSSWCYRFSRKAARVVFAPFASLHIWRVSGLPEPAGGAVVISNHIAHFDPVLLSVAFTRSIDWMTTEEFYVNRFGGAFLRALNTFPVDRSRPDQRALRLGVERLRAGRIVGMFPEGGIRAGTTSILGGAAPKSGAAALARLGNVPIVPMVIFGSDRLYARRSWLPGPPRIPIWIAIGRAFTISKEMAADSNSQLAEALRQLGAATIVHFRLGLDDLPATPQHRKGRDRLPNETK